MPARAAVIDDVKVINSSGSFFDTGRPDLTPALPGTESMQSVVPNTYLDSDGQVLSRSELGISYFGRADKNGGFYFLHNDYCVGICATASKTEIAFTVRNDTQVTEYLRFDSLITPGHLARLVPDPGADPGRAGFSFEVTQSRAPVDGQAQSALRLYFANGTASGGDMSINTTDGDFVNGTTSVNGVATPGKSILNGLHQVDVPGVGRVVDWGATNLNLNLLPLAAGATTVITYVAEYYATTGDDCVDLTRCGGIQVEFGDPRQNGSGANLMAALRGGSLMAQAAAFPVDPPRDVINSEYDDYRTTFRVVDQSTPLRPDQPPPPLLTYDRGFTPSVTADPAPDVPEPATWALMLAGTGLVGAALRRRRTTAAVLA